LRKITELLEKTHLEMVIAFSEALDAKDQYTAGHSRRVMEYSIAIAQRMKLSENEIERLKKSALLHDIGKIGIPDVVLHKKTKLTEDEFAVIKSHPEIGATILKSIKSFKDFVPSVYHHHERYDGKGYPQGIQGEKIPLHARIIAVADSFDAMTSNRPYRDAFLLEAALSELEKNRGIQFDPYIAGVFLKIFEDTPYYFSRYIEPEYYL